jgi:branched-chain amino acid transport system permease protein
MGKLFGAFAFDLAGKTAYAYSFVVLLLVFLLLRLVTRSPFGWRCAASARIRSAWPLSAFPCAAASSPRTRSRPPSPASPGRCSRRPRSSSASTRSASSARPSPHHAGARRNRAPLRRDLGTRVFMLAQDFLAGRIRCTGSSGSGLALVVFVLFARGGHSCGWVRR